MDAKLRWVNLFLTKQMDPKLDQKGIISEGFSYLVDIKRKQFWKLPVGLLNPEPLVSWSRPVTSKSQKNVIVIAFCPKFKKVFGFLTAMDNSLESSNTFI